MTGELVGKLIDFFKAPGPYSAYLVGGGDWDWRKDRDPDWQAALGRLDAYAPWNVGNYRTDKAGLRHARTAPWADDKRECEKRGLLWLPVVYPGFGWTNLKGEGSAGSTIPRDGGRFLWE